MFLFLIMSDSHYRSMPFTNLPWKDRQGGRWLIREHIWKRADWTIWLQYFSAAISSRTEVSLWSLIVREKQSGYLLTHNFMKGTTERAARKTHFLDKLVLQHIRGLQNSLKKINLLRLENEITFQHALNSWTALRSVSFSAIGKDNDTSS